MTTILGIESSCDETAAAVVTDGKQVRSNIVASQIDLHQKYGGVVPEIASRAHIERIDSVIREAMEQAECREEEIDAIATTSRPGLIGSLLIGLTAAKTLSWLWSIPLLSINHVHAHVISPAIELEEDPWPAISLVVSGGHTSLYFVRNSLDISLLGSTIDDAAGEAFDKVASILNLPYPGGPVIDKLARTGNPKRASFPRTMLKSDSLDFSFSGLKTAVLYHVHGPGKISGGLEKLSDDDIADVASSFQAAVVDVLVKKTLKAVNETGVKTVLLGGGVAANSGLRTKMETECNKRKIAFYPAPMIYCGDNAAMIAALGMQHYQKNDFADLRLDAKAS